MQAVWYERKGPAREVLQVGERPLPEPGPNEVRVRVHISAVNPSDTKQRGGARANVTMPFPVVIPHQDGAGVIDAVGPGVDAHRIGQRVWIWNGAGFSSAPDIFIISEKEHHPLCAHVACLPYELYVFVKFFERMGVRKEPDTKQLEHLLVKCLKQAQKLSGNGNAGSPNTSLNAAKNSSASSLLSASEGKSRIVCASEDEPVNI